jgi:type IV pilus assembly protein PilC
MAQFRLKAVSQKGKVVQTEFEASNKKDAQIKVDRLSKTNGLRIQALDQKSTFVYKVKKGGKKPSRVNKKLTIKKNLNVL